MDYLKEAQEINKENKLGLSKSKLKRNGSRSTGTNPRALGTNPRAIKLKEIQGE